VAGLARAARAAAAAAAADLASSRSAEFVTFGRNRDQRSFCGSVGLIGSFAFGGSFSCSGIEQDFLGRKFFHLGACGCQLLPDFGWKIERPLPWFAQGDFAEQITNVETGISEATAKQLQQLRAGRRVV
jgi:hypothetical protein